MQFTMGMQLIQSENTAPISNRSQILIYNDGLSQPNPNPYNAGPIVRRPTGFLIPAGCDTAWNWTRVVTPLLLKCSALDRCATRDHFQICPEITYHY